MHQITGNQENDLGTDKFLVDSIMHPVTGQSVQGANFLINQQRNRIPDSNSVGTRNIELGQIPDESSFAQLFRDLKLSNTGQMVFNVNYNFNSYPSAL